MGMWERGWAGEWSRWCFSVETASAPLASLAANPSADAWRVAQISELSETDQEHYSKHLIEPARHAYITINGGSWWHKENFALE